MLHVRSPLVHLHSASSGVGGRIPSITVVDATVHLPVPGGFTGPIQMFVLKALCYRAGAGVALCAFLLPFPPGCVGV